MPGTNVIWLQFWQFSKNRPTANRQHREWPTA